jgi:vacuolar-type H+-ATPase subunit E/Vma4
VEHFRGDDFWNRDADREADLVVDEGREMSGSAVCKSRFDRWVISSGLTSRMNICERELGRSEAKRIGRVWVSEPKRNGSTLSQS